eukprot:TRINITY_DN1145_c0_g1_i1.p1 TRINITY_DN1145_c0_g1~~TRINITY_DN1145_c0_g1_i1.p1  ORF type:complete len:267 (-),score=3.12 TRINITY_DN1145_c0_g1_i1:427-1227(-)
MGGFQSDFAAYGFRPNSQRSESKFMYRDDANDATNQLTIKLPSRRILSVIARSLLCFLVIASLPWIGSIVGSSSDPAGSSATPLRSHPADDDLSFLPLLFQDLTVEGLIKPGNRAVMIGQADRGRVQVVKERGIDFISETDIERLRSVSKNSLDFVFLDAFSFSSYVEFSDRTLKIGGIIVAIGLTSSQQSNVFRVPINYKIVYLRHFDATVVAMRKIRRAGGAKLTSSTRRRVFALHSSKRPLLNGLEDSLLEPPQRRRHHKRMK